MRFATHSKSKMLAVGNTTGDIFLWDIESPIHNPRKLVSRHNSTIRSLVFSPEGTVLLASADDGSICFWDVL